MYGWYVCSFTERYIGGSRFCLHLAIHSLIYTIRICNTLLHKLLRQTVCIMHACIDLTLTPFLVGINVMDVLLNGRTCLNRPHPSQKQKFGKNMTNADVQNCIIGQCQKIMMSQIYCPCITLQCEMEILMQISPGIQCFCEIIKHTKANCAFQSWNINIYFMPTHIWYVMSTEQKYYIINDSNQINFDNCASIVYVSWKRTQ